MRAHGVPDPVRLDGPRVAGHEPGDDQGEPRRRADVRREREVVQGPRPARAEDGDYEVPARCAGGQAVAARR